MSNPNQDDQNQGGFNADAPAFVPNMNAQAFVPGQGFGQTPGYYNPYMAQMNMQFGYGNQQHGYQQPDPLAQQQVQSQPEPQNEPQTTESASKDAEDVADDWEKEIEEVTEKAKQITLSTEKPSDAEESSESVAEEAKPQEPETAEEVQGASEPAPEEKSPESAEKGESADSQEPVAEEEDDDDDENDDDDVPIELQDHREHLNIVFIGHVDAGKSTIGGHLMYLTGGVDKRTLEKYEREAKEKNRESWYLSWALDTNEEERSKGKTVECGQGHFTTDNKHFTIIDAPGHKSFVPNMISGAAQADVGVLVISARRGEFETGFERGGQTREHAMLAKTAGVKYLVVVINKMDEPTVKWDEGRYEECKQKLAPFLKQVGFKKDEVVYMPVSGLTGANLTASVDKKVCPWYDGPALVPYLDNLPKIVRLLDHPIRLPVSDKYRDMGTIIMGKLQSGIVRKGQKLIVMPNKHKVTVDTLWSDDEEADKVISGDNVKIKLKGIEEEDLNPGYVLCPMKAPCSVTREFDAQLIILEYKSIICAGWSAVLHIHSAVEEVVLKSHICYISRKTGKPDKAKGRPRFVKQGDVCIVRLRCEQPICVETFKEHPDMGRFTLRDEGRTVAIGKVMKLFNTD